MKQNAIIVLAAVVFLVAILLLRQNPENHIYQGKTLKTWASQAYTGDQHAVDIIKEMGPKAVPGLTRMLKAKESFLPKPIWDMILHMPLKWRHPLMKRAGRPNAVMDRAAAAVSLGIIGPAARTAVPELAGTLRDTDPTVRWRAAKTLGRIGKPAVPVLIQALQDKDPSLRHEAAYALGEMGRDAEVAVPALTQALNDQNESVRASTVYSLAMIGTSIIPRLVEIVEHGKGDTPQHAARMLRESYDSALAAVPALIKMAQDDVPARRQVAIETLGGMRAADGPAATAIIAALEDPVIDVRLAAVTALGHGIWQGRFPLPALTSCLRDDSASVRQLVVRTLSEVGSCGKIAIPELARVAEEDKEEAVRRAAGEALRKMEASP